MTKLYVYIGIIILTVLMGLGAFWQHGRYVALSQQFEALQEANKELAEASERADEVGKVKDKAATEIVNLVTQNHKKTQEQIRELTKVVEKGNADEKALMATPLPADVVRVLDNAYQGGNESGDAP